MAEIARAVMLAAPRSNSGKTLVTLGLIRALTRLGRQIAPVKTGPDYIDTGFLAAAAGQPCLNLDPWAMMSNQIMQRATVHTSGADLMVIEAVMGLFDGASTPSPQTGSNGASADLAATLACPIVLVVDVSGMSQSIAALVHGFATYRNDITIAGIILNRVGSMRHETMLRNALNAINMPVFGVLPRQPDLELPSRHLGLVQLDEHENRTDLIDQAADLIANHCDLSAIERIATQLPVSNAPRSMLPPLGQHIAIARDTAFSFIYEHWLSDWREQGAALSFFSPLENQAPPQDYDAIFLPGGYPELHADRLAAAEHFMTALKQAHNDSKLIYGECGGYMVLGEYLTDRDGQTHEMAGLLPVHTRIDRPKRTLGYRSLTHKSPLPFAADLLGHEFHYSSQAPTELTSLFQAHNSDEKPLNPAGAINGRTMGSYMHVIDQVRS